LKYFLKMTFSIITQYLLKIGCKIGLCARVSVCLIALFTSALSSVTASAQNSLTAMRLGNVDIDGQMALRLVIETAVPQQAKMLLLSDPWRLVLDYDNMEWAVAGLPSSGQLSLLPAIGYRFGHPKPGSGRLVIEFARPASPESAFTLPPKNNGHRLVIDLMDRGEISFKLAQKALANGAFQATSGSTIQNSVPVVVPAPAKPASAGTETKNATGRAVTLAVPQSRPKRWVVAIDAGHGGKDPGAIGRRGTHEKKITLAAARQLAAHLNATGKVKARLVRSGDRYLKLRQRIQVARDMGADAFISLHADSAQRSSARGISVFSLSDKASDKEAAYLAARENKADLIGGPDLGAEDPLAANALLGMFQRETMNESAHLARAILNEIKGFPGGDKRGHRFAGFAVLKSPDVPSVLVEMGFLSNVEDEKNLNSSRYQDKLTKQIAKALVVWLEGSGR
jgi:N-acetylmuramoyl-L-alanine amidase